MNKASVGEPVDGSFIFKVLTRVAPPFPLFSASIKSTKGWKAKLSLVVMLLEKGRGNSKGAGRRTFNIDFGATLRN